MCLINLRSKVIKFILNIKHIMIKYYYCVVNVYLFFILRPFWFTMVRQARPPTKELCMVGEQLLNHYKHVKF